MRGRKGSVAVLFGAILFSMPLSATDPPSPEAIARGESLYRQKCRDCHGRHANRRALGKSGPLTRLGADDIAAKLRAVQREGKARTAWDIMKSGLGEADILSLGIYVRSLKRR